MIHLSLVKPLWLYVSLGEKRLPLRYLPWLGVKLLYSFLSFVCVCLLTNSYRSEVPQVGALSVEPVTSDGMVFGQVVEGDSKLNHYWRSQITAAQGEQKLTFTVETETTNQQAVLLVSSGEEPNALVFDCRDEVVNGLAQCSVDAAQGQQVHVAVLAENDPVKFSLFATTHKEDLNSVVAPDVGAAITGNVASETRRVFAISPKRKGKLISGLKHSGGETTLSVGVNRQPVGDESECFSGVDGFTKKSCTVEVLETDVVYISLAAGQLPSHFQLDIGFVPENQTSAGFAATNSSWADWLASFVSIQNDRTASLDGAEVAEIEFSETRSLTVANKVAEVSVPAAIPEKIRSYSSVWGYGHHARSHANSSIDSDTAWSAQRNYTGQWLELPIPPGSAVTGIRTQGRADRDQWVTSYRVKARLRDGTYSYIDGGAALQANTDRDTVVTHELDVPIEAVAVRVLPTTWYGHISMRAGLMVRINELDETEYNPADAERRFSSIYRYDQPGVGYGRSQLNSAQAWSPKRSRRGQWIDVPVPSGKLVTGIKTQGRADADEWVTSYRAYALLDNGNKVELNNGEPLVANSDRLTVAEQSVVVPQNTRWIRVYPEQWNREIALRIALTVADMTSAGYITAKIPGQIRSYSSEWGHHWFGAHHPKSELGGRLAWTARRNDLDQWLELPVPASVHVVGVRTQGRRDRDQWVDAYRIEARLSDGSSIELDGGESLIGNSDRDSVVDHFLQVPLIAVAIRLKPTSWRQHIAMRADLLVQPLNLPRDEFNTPEEDRRYSSVYAGDSNGSGYARSQLNSVQAWSAGRRWFGQWMEISVPEGQSIVGLKTQGRADKDQWVKQYRVYGITEDGKQLSLNRGRPLSGNSDRDTVVEHKLVVPQEVKTLRIEPTSWHRWVSMRAALEVVQDVEAPLEQVGTLSAERLPATDTKSGVFIVPQGVQKIVLSMKVGAGQDADLFARVGREASRERNDCASIRDSGQSEGCVLDVKEGDVVFYSLEAIGSTHYLFFSAAEKTQENANNQIVSGESLELDGQTSTTTDYFYEAGELDALVASVVEHQGDVQLLLGIDRLPTLEDHDCLSDSSADAIEICTLSGVQYSTVFARVISQGASAHYLSFSGAGSIDETVSQETLVHQQSDDGIVSVEAEAAARSSSTDAQWVSQGDILASAARSALLQGDGFSADLIENPMLEVRYAATSDEAGNIWLRIAKESTTSARTVLTKAATVTRSIDSALFISANAQDPQRIDLAGVTTAWQWISAGQIVQQLSDDNVLQVWGAEEGVKIDKIVVTTDDGNIAGTGPGSSSVEGEVNGGGTEQGEQPDLPESIVSTTDTDGDGLLDQWEIDNFGNLDQNAKDDTDGDGQSNAQEFSQGSDPTATSPIIADLKSRPVVPGAVGGSLAVSASGAAVYTVPIELPPGVNGHAPSLSLNYSSQAGVGPLGMGWTLSGLSSISRCGKSKVLNGEHHGVDYSKDDLLCLDGQQLLPIDNNYDDYWSDGKTYHPAMDPDTRVTGVYRTGLSKSLAFSVEHAGGVSSSFDNVVIRNVGSGSGLTSWNITSQTDVSGNKIKYSYRESGSGSNNTIIDKISYGSGTEDHVQIDFNFIDGVSTRKLRIADDWVSLDKVLSSISIGLRKNGSEIDNVLIYGMDYRSSEHLNSGAYVNHLEAIYKCEPVTCLAAEKYTWNPSLAYSPIGKEISNGSSSSNIWKPSTAGRQLTGDFNNDGLSDILELGSGRGHVRFTTEGSAAAKVVEAFGALDVDDFEFDTLGDFDGDGLLDVVITTKKSVRVQTGEDDNGDPIYGSILVRERGKLYFGTGSTIAPFEGGMHFGGRKIMVIIMSIWVGITAPTTRCIQEILMVMEKQTF